MRATSMATLVELLEELRELTQQRVSDSSHSSRMAKVTQDEKVKALWTDVLRLLNAEQQVNVARFDAWLQRIEDQLEAGGDTVKLIDVGLKVTDRRSRELKLDTRTVPPPAWDPDFEADMEALGVKLRPEVPDPQA